MGVCILSSKSWVDSDINKYFLSACVLWPYFGFYGKNYFQLSVVVFLFFIISRFDLIGIKFSIFVLMSSMSLFLLGQLIYGIDLLSVREAVRLSIIIIGGYYGYRHVNNLPFNGLAFLIFVLYFVSITFHPNVAIISNIFASIYIKNKFGFFIAYNPFSGVKNG